MDTQKDAKDAVNSITHCKELKCNFSVRLKIVNSLKQTAITLLCFT